MHGSAAVLGITVGKAGKSSAPEESPACLPRAEVISGERVLGPGSGDPLNILEAFRGWGGQELGRPQWGSRLHPALLHRGGGGDQEDFGTCYQRCCSNRAQSQHARRAPRPAAAGRARRATPVSGPGLGERHPALPRAQHRSRFAPGLPAEASAETKGLRALP